MSGLKTRSDKSAFELQGNAAVILILAPNSINTLKSSAVALQVSQDATLTIDSTGSLTAIGGKGDESGAVGGNGNNGIGGSGTITINGGIVTAIGGAGGKGSSAGKGGEGGSGGIGIGIRTIINNGSVTATGGIGGNGGHIGLLGGGGGNGIDDSGTAITINKGSVTATGGTGGNGGIGGTDGSGIFGTTTISENSNVKTTAINGTTTISGGTVTADKLMSATTISGGTVTAAKLMGATTISGGTVMLTEISAAVEIPRGKTATIVGTVMNKGIVTVCGTLKIPTNDGSSWTNVDVGQLYLGQNGTIYGLTENTHYINTTDGYTAYGDFWVKGGTLGADYTYSDGTLTVSGNSPITIAGGTRKDKIVVADNATADITLNGLGIDMGDTPVAFMLGSQATVNLTLAENSKNRLKGGCGLQVSDDASLIIKGTGSLTAIGYSYNPSIGGFADSITGLITGSITINSGMVTAQKIYGAFSTGPDGSAIIVADSFSDNSAEKKKMWKGLIFDGNTGVAYSNTTLKNDFEIPSGKTLAIPENITLTIDTDKTLTNRGTINIAGTLTNNGTFRNYGTITGNVTDGGGREVQSSQVTVSFGEKTTADYGEEITIFSTAKVKAHSR